ncbi:hypothetical protein HU200_010001 [Digitaria exilis]|uniref:Auxin-responsive protein n=1 Tax=Digitaria exilis TaxID=1010633 RepID=A0A835KQC3_9POAL|nr:hypothetical protein HU200_010001 [Digitaria exilis]
MDEMRSMDASVEPEVVVQPGLSASRFVKVFMQGGVVGRKVNLATHKNYASLSFALNRLGEQLLQVFIISVKRIYIVPVPQDQENVADNEEEEEDRENGDDNAATSAAPLDGDNIPANDDEGPHNGDATASTAADGASEE